MAFLSEDRKAGIIPELSVRETSRSPHYRPLRNGASFPGNDGRQIDRFMQRLGIKAVAAEDPVSGGNQRRSFARWLCKNTKLLLLDEPTRGIDVGAKGRSTAHRRTAERGSGT